MYLYIIKSGLFDSVYWIIDPWFISDVKLNKEETKVDILIDFERGARFHCPNVSYLMNFIVITTILALHHFYNCSLHSG